MQVWSLLTALRLDKDYKGNLQVLQNQVRRFQKPSFPQRLYRIWNASVGPSATPNLDKEYKCILQGFAKAGAPLSETFISTTFIKELGMPLLGPFAMLRFDKEYNCIS